MRKILISAAVATVAMVGSANAALLTFKGDGVDLPTSVADNTPCSPSDICGTALTYSTSEGDVVVTATANNGETGHLVVQDINPTNSGLGVYSELGRGVYNGSIRSLDEIDAAAGEAIVLTFASAVRLSDFEWNNGTDQDCPDTGAEGGCGSIEIIVDGVSAGTFVATAMMAQGFVGTEFIFRAVDQSLHLAALNVGGAQTPLPAAALFMGTGLVAFARRRKQAK